MTGRTEPPAPGPGLVPAPLRLLRWARGPLERVLGWPRRPRPAQDLDDAVAEVQLDLLVRAFKEGGGVGTHVGTRDDSYLYRPGRLLVRSEDSEELRRYFVERKDRFGGVGESGTLLPGLDTYLLPPRADVPGVLADLDGLDDFADDLARPDHVLYVTGQGVGKLCPADEPRVPGKLGPVPAPVDDPSLGKEVRVSVVDTGWWEPAETNGVTPWLGPVDGVDLVGGETDPGIGTGRGPTIESYAGHGTFVAGVVRCVAPATEIRHEAILVRAGGAYESDIARQLADAVLTRYEPHVISISAGTYTRRDRGLLAIEALWAAEERREGAGAVLVVAAAGNDSSTRPFFPAAYDWAVGVGALDVDGTVSSFSNTGRWVDVYAHGRDLVNAFPTGTYECHEPPHAGDVRHFDGLAVWSGTSFATPVVSGAVAARMSATGLPARAAYDDLVAGGRPLTDPHGDPIIGVGPPFV